jgi:hypothetical protein
MKINEILLESEVQNLEEGPILNKIGSAVGKGVGAVAKGAGAMAGGVAGLGAAAKKGFQAGKQTVAGAGDDPATDPNAAAPEKPQGFMAGLKQGLSGKKSAPATTAQDINAQGPKGTAAAKTQSGAGAQAIAKTSQAAGGDPEKAGQTLYAQVKSQVNQLDKKGKTRIMQLLQKSLHQAPAKPAATDPNAAAVTPAADPNAAAPAAEPAATAAPAAEPAATAAPANTMANAPVSATNTAAADNPNQPPPTKKRGGRVAGAAPSETPDAIRKRNARRDKKNAAATTGGAGAFNQLTQQATQQNAGKVNYGPALAEALARRIQVHKQQSVEQLQDSKENRGTIVAESFSLFRKH